MKDNFEHRLETGQPSVIFDNGYSSFLSQGRYQWGPIVPFYLPSTLPHGDEVTRPLKLFLWGPETDEASHLVHLP